MARARTASLFRRAAQGNPLRGPRPRPLRTPSSTPPASASVASLSTHRRCSGLSKLLAKPPNKINRRRRLRPPSRLRRWTASQTMGLNRQCERALLTWLQRNAARPGSHDDTSEGKRDPSKWPKIPDAMIEPTVRLETADRKARGAFGGFRGQIKQNGPSERL